MPFPIPEQRRYMCSPTTTIGTPNDQPEGWELTLHKPHPEDLNQRGLEVNQEEQVQQTNSLLKDILHHHYKDDPFMCNLLTKASVKLTENTTNETLELELEGTDYSVSSNQPITIRIEGAHELIMALKEIYQIKIGPLPTRWRHHDMPNITDKKIKELNEPDLEGPPTQAEAEAAFDGISLGTHKYDYASFWTFSSLTLNMVSRTQLNWTDVPITLSIPVQQNTRRNAVQRTMYQMD